MNNLKSLFVKSQTTERYHSKMLLDKVEYLNKYNLSKVNISIIKKAITYAKRCHAGQFRESGETYFCHPLQVAYMVSGFCFKADIIVTAILHDTIEDTQATKEEITELFGAQIAQNVIALSRIKISGVKTSSAEMVISLLKNKQRDLLIVKLFDRLHNIRTIDVKPVYKIKKIIKETIDIFIDLAAYLHMQDVKNELICTCSKYDNLLKNYDLENCIDCRISYSDLPPSIPAVMGAAWQNNLIEKGRIIDIEAQNKVNNFNTGG